MKDSLVFLLLIMVVIIKNPSFKVIILENFHRRYAQFWRDFLPISGIRDGAILIQSEIYLEIWEIIVEAGIKESKIIWTISKIWGLTQS